MYDQTLADFPRLSAEQDDTPRIQRAISATAHGVLYVPKGIYLLTGPIRITNFCSLLLHKSAILRAQAPMDFVVWYDGGPRYQNLLMQDETGALFDDLNLFISGGEIDGNGLASCLCINNYHHFTLRDMALRNGKRYGLRVGQTGYGFELIAHNIYCRCTMPGLAGNVGISSKEGDSHYTDCIVVDYTTGIELLGGGANRLTRCHVWGGVIPPAAPGRPPEMLENSVCYRLSSGDALLRDCYADTGKTGFEVVENARLLGCAYYNNYDFKLDDVTVIHQTGGALLVTDGYFSKTSPRARMYSGTGQVRWQNNTYIGGLTPPDTYEATNGQQQH